MENLFTTEMNRFYDVLADWYNTRHLAEFNDRRFDTFFENGKGRANRICRKALARYDDARGSQDYRELLYRRMLESWLGGSGIQHWRELNARATKGGDS